MHALIGHFYHWLYQLDVHYFLEVRMHTWLNGLLAMFAVVALLVRVPYSVVAALLALAFLLICSLGSRFARRRYYIHFVPQKMEPPEDPPPPLWPEDKLLHHATGHFHVEDKEGDWTHLIAYYRTFETREHAVMARLTPSFFLRIGMLDPLSLGMWYIFITPEALLAVTPGRSYFGPMVEPALRLRWQRKDEKGRPLEDIAFLHFQSEADLVRVMADLLLDMGGPARRPWRPPRLTTNL